MKIQGNFNRISDKLKATIPVLKQGETVTYLMLNGVPNPDPDENEKRKNPILYGRTQIPTNDRIFDPYFKNDEGKEVGRYVDIGAVAFFDKDEPNFVFLYPSMGHSIPTGRFSLSGGNASDAEMYEFLSLSNRNESNPNRDKSVTPLFKVLNAIADSKATSSKIDILRKSINLAAEIVKDEAACRKLAASLNWNEFKNFEELKAEIDKFASRNPDQFILAYDDPNQEIKATIKKALDADVIKFDITTGDVTFGASSLTKLTDSRDILGGIFDWQQSAKNGDKVLAAIKKQLEKASELEAA